MRASTTLWKTIQPSLQFGDRTYLARLGITQGIQEKHTVKTDIFIFRNVTAFRKWRTSAGLRRLHLVPTMGALHEGHLELIRAAARRGNNVVVSIYVNPAQFGIKEDLASYPVTWDADMEKLRQVDHEIRQSSNYQGRVTAILAPTTEEMYPSGFPGQEVDSKGTFVTVTPVSEVLEGASRPTFFRGVATVCLKLFNIVRPTAAFFGRKDVQQTVVVRKMCRDLLVRTKIEVCDTVRESDGLAMSSRNVYLGTRRRAVAIVLRGALLAAEKKFNEGERSREAILGAAEEVVRKVQAVQERLPLSERVTFRVDYISLSDPENMQELDTVSEEKGAILSGAIYMDKIEEPQEGEDVGEAGGPMVRLLDNIMLGNAESFDVDPDDDSFPEAEERPGRATPDHVGYYTRSIKRE